MGKRILSFLLAVVMVFGMVPATAIPTFAAETTTGTEETIKPNIFAAYIYDLAHDGNLSETSWLTYGKMTAVGTTEVITFGTLWDRENLYIGVNSEDDATVKINGKAVNGIAKKVGATTEIAISFLELGMLSSEVLDAEISVGNYKWDGTITLSVDDRELVVNHSYFAAGNKSNCTAGENGSLILKAPGSTSGRSRAYAIELGCVPLYYKNRDLVVEFDFTATDIPVISETPLRNGTFICDGFLFALFHGAKGPGYTIGIANTTADGLVLCVKGKTGGYTVPLGKENGDTFHIRLEHTAGEKLAVYIDDQHLQTFDDPTSDTGWSGTSAAMLNFNAFDDSKSGKPITCEVANIRVGTHVDADTLWDDVVASLAYSGSYGALSFALAPVIDGVADDHIWGRYYNLVATDGSSVTGKVSAAWLKNKLYLAVEQTGATTMDLRLGSNAWTLALAGDTIASNDGAVTGKKSGNSIELEIDLLKTSVDVAAYDTKAPIYLALTNGTDTAMLVGRRNIVFSNLHTKYIWSYTDKAGTAFVPDATSPVKGDYTYTVNSAGAETISYMIFTNREEVNHADDMYLQQTIKVNKLGVSDGSLASIPNGKGYGFWFTDANDSGDPSISTFLLYNKNGELTIRTNSIVKLANNFVDIPLGIPFDGTAPVEFTLGYLWRADNVVEVYVNGEYKGCAVENNYRSSSYGQNAFRMNTYGVEIDMEIDDFYISAALNNNNPNVTTQKILDQAGVDTAAVIDALPTVYEEGNFKFNVSWNSSNPAVVAADGTVTKPVGGDVVVEVAAVVNGVKLQTVSITVPAVLNYESAHADNIAIDGAMNEAAWNAMGKLSGGQPFDILWDKDYLYVAAVPGNGDTSMTVSVGGQSVTVNSGDAAWGAAVEAKVPCAISDYGVLEGVTITMGTSSWSGNAVLVGLERTLNITTDNLGTVGCSGVSGVNPVASADKSSYTFTLDPRDTEPAANDRVYAYSSGHSVLKNRTGDISIEFDFAATELPLLNNGSGFMGAGIPQWAGPTVAMSDNQLNGIIFGIQNIAGNLKFCIVYEDAAIAKAKGVPYYSELALGKLPGDTFHLRVLWKENGNVAVYVDGTFVGELENVTANGTYMDLVWMGTANTLWVNLHRQLRYYASKVEFTISNIKMGNSYGETAMDALDFDSIKGENMIADQIVSDLSLPNTVTTRHFGSKAVTWTSNSAAISNTGVVTATDADTAVTLTATSGASSKSFELNVAANNIKADFAGNARAAALAATDSAWTFAQWRPMVVKSGDAAPSGYVAALISGGKVYVAVKSEGASSVEATLAGSTLNEEITGDVVVLCFDDVQLTGYNQDLDFQVILTGSNDTTAKLWTSGKLTVTDKKLVLESMDVPTDTTTATGRVDISADGEVIKFPAAGRTNPPINHSEALWLLQNMNLDGVLVNDKDMLLEQTICINKMPVGDRTGLFTAAPAQGNGYKITAELLNNRSSTTHRVFTTNIYPDAQNNLWAKVLKHDGTTSEPIALGKTFGQTFKLGLLYGTDNSTTVYVDGAPVAVIESSAYLYNIYTVNTILLKYEDPACTSIDMVDFTVSDLTMTHLDPGTERKTETLPAIALTKSALLGDVNLSNLSGKLVLPAVTGEYLNIPLTWVWEGDEIIDKDGNVLYNEERALTATLTLKVGEEEIWTENVTVPKYDFEGWLDANRTNTEIKSPATKDKPVLDGVFDEIMWAKATELSYVKLRGISGRVYTAWGLGKLYLAVEFAGSTDMALTFGENTWNIDLSNAEIDFDGIVTGKVVGNKAELVIDLLAAGVEVTAYNQTAPFQVVLGDAGHYAKLTNEATLDLVFSDYESARFNVGGTDNKTAGVTPSEDGRTLVFENDDTLAADGKPARQYKILGSSLVNRNSDIYLEQTITVDRMNNLHNGQIKSTDKTIDYTDGYYFLIADQRPIPEGSGYSTYAVITYANLWNNNGMLTLKVNGSARETDIPLDKGLNDTFTLGYLWTVGDPAVDADDTVEVYVDGVLKGIATNVSYEAGGVGKDTYVLNLRCDAKVTVSDVIQTTYMNAVTPADPSAGLLEKITFNPLTVNLPTSHVIGHFLYPVTWESNNESVVTKEGKVIRPLGNDATVTLIPTVAGTKLEAQTATVPGQGIATINAYLMPDSAEIALDGVLNEKQWILPITYGVTENGVARRIFAAWKARTLYLAVEGVNGGTMTLNVGSKSYTITLSETINTNGVTGAFKNGVVELAIPVPAEDLTGYNYAVTFNFTVDGVSLGDGLRLSFSGYSGRTLNFNEKDYLLGATVVSANELQFSTTMAERQYWGDCDLTDGLGLDKVMYLEQTLDIKNMSVSDGAMSSDLLVKNGYNFWISEKIDETTTSNCTVAALYYKSAAEGLILRVRQAGTLNENYAEVKLNRYPGDGPFTLGYLWNIDHSVSIYVNNELVGTVADAYLESIAYVGRNAVMLNNIGGHDITVTDLTLTVMRYSAVRDEITAERVFAGIDVTKVENGTKLPMNNPYESVNTYGTQEITWVSSHPDVIAEDGTVTARELEDVEVTVTAKIGETELWSQVITVKRSVNALDALLSEEPVEVDGKLNEMAYMDWKRFGDKGTLAAAWARGYVYFAVNGNDTDTLTLTINGVTFTVNMATGATTGDGITAVKNDATGLVEIGIEQSKLNGFTLTDYNQCTTFTAMMGDTPLDDAFESLNFSGKVAEPEALNKYGSAGVYSPAGNGLTYDQKAQGMVHYLYENDNPIDHAKVVILSQDYQFDKLPADSGNILGSATANGFYAWFNDGETVGSSTKGTMVFYTIFADENGQLNLRLSNAGKNDGSRVYELDRSLGEKFRLTFVWNPDDTLEMYVDGALLAIAENASYYATSAGADVITYRFFAEASEARAKYTVNNVTLITSKYENAKSELTQQNILGNIDPAGIRNDLNMVSSYDSAAFAGLPLFWTSSNESVISTSGKVTRHATQDQKVTITAYYGDTADPENFLFTLDVTVLSLTSVDQEAPAIIRTAFAPEGSIKLDGTIKDGNWLLNGWLLDANSAIFAEFGAQWNLNYLYLAVDMGSATSLFMQLGNKTFSLNKAEKLLKDSSSNTVSGSQVAVSGSIAEIKIPITVVIPDGVNDYGAELDIILVMNDRTYSGKLQLASTEWWATQNKQLGLTASSAPQKNLGGDPNPKYQGAAQNEKGWHMFDYYANGVTNGVRTYVMFQYNNFDDRTKGTHVEFDFLAKSLPVFEKWRDDKLGDAYACYGFTFSLGNLRDAAKNAHTVVGGIYNTADGLVFVFDGDNPVHIPLEKEDGERYKVGEEFRVGVTWHTDGAATLFIDGREIQTVGMATRWLNSVANSTLVCNIVRDTAQRKQGDDIDIYLSNMAFGKDYDTDNLLTGVTFDTIRGQNEYQDEIMYNLNLITSITNGQLPDTYDVVWTTSNEAVIEANGTVHRPATGIAVATLTATCNGVSKSFTLYVRGQTTANNGVMILTNDKNPFTGAGKTTTYYSFTFDTANNSIIRVLDSKTRVNLVTLHDLDEVSRLNRESLRLFISDDNKTYTEIEDYKLLHIGLDWYLYDFDVQAKYVKIHYTHFDGEHADFINHPGNMISAAFDASFSEEGQTITEVQAPATTLRDQAVELPGEYDGANLRISLNGELLYHYVKDDGTVVVRIPDPTDEVLHIWNANGGIQLDNKENVYEVTYGTRETTLDGGRWLISLPAGTRFNNGDVLAVETLYAYDGDKVSATTDGYNWTVICSKTTTATPAGKTAAKPVSCGGWGFDHFNGRFLFEGYTPEGADEFNFEKNDPTKSFCETHINMSDDGGKTWYWADTLNVAKDGKLQSNYVLSYSDIVELSGNDGTGSNVDFLLNMGGQYNGNGAFCGRIAYSKDGGDTWFFSESLISFGNENAFEGGVSEGTILERDDGTLVYYARCQATGTDNFAQSYSLDHGVTWLTPGLKSDVYTVNTQALMYKYDLDRNGTKEASVFVWGGNNVQGGNSYTRNPLNYAVSTNEMDTFRNIQNTFAETFMEVYTTKASHYITNPSSYMIGESMYVSFGRLKMSDSVRMKINDFTNWFTRTKGAYDSFEHGTAHYEGWVTYAGSIEATKTLASVGSYAMLANKNTAVSRSIPYLQNGTVAIDIYGDSNADFTLELQPAFTSQVGKVDLVAITVEGTTLKLSNGETIQLNAGQWNTVTFELKLTDGLATVNANGITKSVPVKSSVGDYVCYLALMCRSAGVYVDEFFVESDMDAVTTTSDADKAAANEVIEKIKALPAAGEITKADSAAIAAARAAYTALTPVQRDWVDRRINETNGATALAKDADITEYMTNYYDVLVAAEEALDAIPEVEVDTDAPVEDDKVVTLPENSGLTDDTVNEALNATVTRGELAAVVESTVKDTVQVTKDEAVAALGGSYDPNGAAPTVEIRSYLTANYEAPVGNSMTVDLKAMYQVYAVQGSNSAKIGNAEALNTEGEEITITIVLPAAFVEGKLSTATVKHYKDGGDLVETYENLTIQKDGSVYFITFTNTKGFSEFEVIVEDAPAPALQKLKLNLTLDEAVIMNFKINANLVDDDAYAVVTKNGVTVAYTTDTYEGEFRVRVPVESDEMCETVSVQIFNGEGEAISLQRSMSVRDYGRALLDTNQEDKYYRAIIAMLDYGAAAQLLADSTETDLANNVIREDERALFDGFWPEATELETEAYTGKIFSVNLTLDERIIMNFKVDPKYKEEGYSFVVTKNGEPVAYKTDEFEGKYRIRISLDSDEMLKDIRVELHDANGLVDARRMNIREYSRLILNTNPDAEVGRAMVAMLDYGACAQLLSTDSKENLANSHITSADRAYLDFN